MKSFRACTLAGFFDGQSVSAAFEVSYDLGGGLFSPEQVPGFRGYFSLTGEANSWVVIPGLCTGTTGTVATVISFPEFGVWFPGAPLFLLWADDNGPNSDGYYTIDNFRVNVAPRLEIRPAGAGVVEVSWLAGWGNHTLWVSPGVAQPDWQLAIGTTAITSGRVQMRLDALSERRFFRTRGDVIIPGFGASPR